MKGLSVIALLALAASGFLSKSITSVSGTSPDYQSPGSQSAVPAPPAREARVLGKLKSLLEPLGFTVNQQKLINPRRVNSHRRLLIKWEAHPDSASELVPEKGLRDHTPSGRMSVLEDKQASGGFHQPFDLKLGSGKVFVIGVDKDTQLRWWDLIDDPRILRSEYPGPDGQLTGTTHYHATAHLFVTLPDSPEIVGLQFLLPKVSGSEYVLEPFASLSVK